MSPLTPSQLQENLTWRYATKQFDPAKKISPEVWSALEESLRLAPSSFGLQLWKFFVVENPKLRKELRSNSWGQSQIEEASHLVIFAVKSDITTQDVERLINATVQARGVAKEQLKEYQGMMEGFVKGMTKEQLRSWASRQVYIALGFFLTSAATLKVDACPMEGLDAAKYDEILGIASKGYTTLCVATAGYRATTDKYASLTKIRYPAKEVIEHIK